MDSGDSLTVQPGAAAARSAFWRTVLGYALAGAGLIWVFHDVHIERMAGYIGSMSWWWVLPAVASDILGYVCDAVRWRVLLLPVGRMSLLRATQAVYVGLFANEVMPMRLGELVRAYLASRWLGRHIPDVIPSMLVSRLLDGVWMAIGFGLVAILVPLPRDLMLGGDVFGAVVLLLAGVFLCLALGKSRFGGRFQGFQQIGAGRTMAVAGAFSFAFLAFEVISFWLVMEAFHLGLPLSAGAAVYLIVRLGTVLPNAPANVGSYQFFTVLGLSLFGIEKTRATGFSVVVFILLTLPLWALGLAALSRTGMTLSNIRADIRSAVRLKDGG
ncbi:MAG: lysylphosphatidylglycerol synthase transmembrane domain-containing protein [Bryobacteraceae bacterium]